MIYNTIGAIRRAMMLLVCMFFVLTTSSVMAASTEVDVVPDETVGGSVELTPGYIGGVIDIGGQSISRIDLTARSTDYSAKIYPQAEGPYVMTVNVPQGGTLEYDLTGTVWMNNWNTRMYFKNRSAVVAAGATTKVDYIVDAGYVAGRIVANGCTVQSGEVWAILDNGTAYTRAYTKFGSGGSFRLPVQPNAGIRVYGQAVLSSGATVTLDSRYLDVAPGQDAPVSWEMDCGPGLLGSILHDVNYNMPMDYHYSYLYNNGAWSPYRTSRHDGTTLFDNIAPGKWKLYTYSYWNGGHNMISKQLTDIDVPSGETVHASIDEKPGFLKGTVSLKGTKSIQDASYAYIYAYGKNQAYPSYLSTSRSLMTREEGTYNLALPHGEWDAWLSTYVFNNFEAGSEYLYSTLYMYDYSLRKDSIYIEPSQVLEGPVLSYETGTATIKYSRSDGGSFSSPYIYAKCYRYNDAGGLDSYIYSYSRGEATGNSVTFIGFPGTYEVEAWATVEGSLTTFGKVKVEIVPGVNKVVDIGGPTLDIKSPAAQLVTQDAKVQVTGTATDDMGVERIVINGMDVPFVSTNNPDDPNQVSFVLEMTLVEGENEIETVAYDISGNVSSDKRSVTLEIPEPEFVSLLVDIKPGSCKNPLNVKSKGVLPVVIIGSGEMDVSLIDPSTLKLEGVAPVRWAVDDAASLPESGDPECSTDQPDGFLDMALKFDTQEMVEVLGDVKDGDVKTLVLTGELKDGTLLDGEDTVTVLVKGNQKTGGKKK